MDYSSHPSWPNYYSAENSHANSLSKSNGESHGTVGSSSDGSSTANYEFTSHGWELDVLKGQKWNPRQQVSQASPSCHYSTNIPMSQPVNQIPVYSPSQPTIQHFHSIEREAAREARSAAKKEVAFRSGTEIVNFDGRLCMTSPTGRYFQIMDIAPTKILYVELDPLYRVASYYILLFKEIKEPIYLPEKIVNGKSLGSELVKETGFQLRHKYSESKISMFLRNYLNKNCEKVYVNYYHGWNVIEGVPSYHLFNNTTHGHRSQILHPDDLDVDKTQGHPVRSINALIAAEKYADILDVFHSFEMRCDMSMTLHLSFLYGLLKHWGYRFPFGFCFRAKHSSVLSILKALLCWYGDESISLQKRPASLQDDILERKDQPIVIESNEGTNPNCKLVSEALSTGYVSSNDKPDGSPLQGVICAVVQHTSDLSFCNNIATVEVAEQALRSDGLCFLTNQLPYLQEYFLNLAAYITHHAARLKADFDANMTAFRDMDFGFLCPNANSVEAAGILYAVAELVRDYHDSLAPTEGLKARLSLLTDSDCVDRMLTRFVDASCNTDNDSSIISLFATLLQESIDSGELPVLDYCVGIPMHLPTSKTPLVLDDGKHYMLTHNAMALVVKKIGGSPDQLKRLLRDAEILIGTPSNQSTYETRPTIRLKTGGSIKVPVYKLDKEKLFDPTLYI